MKWLALLLCPVAVAETFTWIERGDGRLELAESGRTVFVYNHGPGRACCYLHPLQTPAGVVLTDDAPADHLHHRGLFWAWPIVEVGGERADLWLRKGITHRFDRIALREAGARVARLTAEHSWVMSSRQVVRETVSFTVHPASRGEREIEVILTFDAIGQAVTIAGAPEENKGYGGFSSRFAPREQTRLLSSDGPVPRDEDRNPHEWAELEAVFAGARAGLRIRADQRNPDYPNSWCLRHYGFVGANFPGTQAFRIEPGRTLTLRYRVTLFDRTN